MFTFKKKSPQFLSPASGTILQLSDVPDPVFSQKMMGDGFAIDLQDGEIVAPCNGEIRIAFPTGHAYGIRSEDGMEVLIHIGLDTVELNGEGFHPQVSAGMHVLQGDVLVKIDLDVIKQHEKSLISPIIFTNGEQIQVKSPNQQVKKLDDVIKIK